MPKVLHFQYFECGACGLIWKTVGGVRKHAEKAHGDTGAGYFRKALEAKAGTQQGQASGRRRGV